MEVKVYSNAHSTLENAPPPPHIHDSLDDDLESGSLLRLGFNPKFESLKQKEVGITLQWSNIKYSVGPKQILNGITGVCEPGNVLAVMGPSGSGKTTLMNTLSGRILAGKKNTVLTGKILCNGEKIRLNNTFKKSVGYVTQEDYLFPTVTCFEAFEFSARLRLSNQYSEAERKALIEDILESLGLANVRDSVIGNAMIRGVSGGERKRIAIGVELLSHPRVLFLDEPTSGLDSYSAWKVLKILRAIAALNTSIICSIHQPSSEIFNEFTHLCLLTAGVLIYQGPVSGVDEEFKKKNLPCPPKTNVADHVILLCQTLPLHKLPNPTNGNHHPAQATGDDDGFSIEMDGELLAQEVKASFILQTTMLTNRTFKNYFRDRLSLLAKIGMVLGDNVLFIIIFQNVGDQALVNYNTQSHFGSLVMCIIGGMMVALLPNLLVFPLERVVFLREVNVGTYNLLPYFFSKFLVEIPEALLMSIVNAVMTYYPLKYDGNIFLYGFAFFLIHLASTSAAYVLGTFANNPSEAIILAPAVMVPQILFMGLFIRVDQIVVWLRWAQYLCAAKYSLNLSAIAIFDPANAKTPSIEAQWRDLAKNTDYSTENLWLYIVLLISLFVGFRLFSFMILMMKKKAIEG